MNSTLTAARTRPLHRSGRAVPAAPGAVREREEAERELLAAHTELASLGAAASPSRLERALERLAAAEHMLALAA